MNMTSYISKFLCVAVILIVQLQASAQNYQLVWSDEFTTSIGPDWVFETGGGGWGNNEKQFYQQQNATVSNGNLVITAKKESVGGMPYTSARMITRGKKSWTYGKIEARLKTPKGQGLWPAFWMLGDAIGDPTIGWPKCGEIDIMEQINNDATTLGTPHWDNNGWVYQPGTTGCSINEYHIYSVTWDASSIKWFVDGVQFHQLSILNNVNSTDEFHKPFFILLNIAVGGNLPGQTIDDSRIPAQMLVDYVRVYQATGGPQPCSSTYTNVPATIQAESYCTSAGIQVENTTDAGGGQNVGWIDANDYMVYRVNVPTSGSYKIQYRIASQNGGGSIRFEKAGGTPVYGTIAVPSTGGWQTWQTISHDVTLSAGQQEVALTAAAGGFNINWFSITPNNSTFSTTIQAENYSAMAGIQTENCSEGGLNVGWVDAGDWLAYNSVTIPASGTYRVIYRVASPNAGKTLRLEKDAGATQLGTVTIPNTGGWQTWTNVAHNVTLPAGTYTLGIATATGGFNINHFTITNNLSARMSTEGDFITEGDDNALAVFPNPSNGVVTIRVSKPSQVDITDVSGRTVHSSHVEESLTIDRMNAGLYIVRMHNSLQSRTQKLVIK
jgi:beta-glucanase (GH16 family)